VLTPGGPLGLRIVRPEPMKMSKSEKSGRGDDERPIFVTMLRVRVYL
jgi:hypothetical protein